MSIKIRFALMFTLFVAIVLAASSVTIFILYSSYREDEFYSRVKSEGVIFHDLVYEIKDPNRAVLAKMVSGVYTNTVFDEKLVVTDSTGYVLSKIPYTFVPRVGLSLLKTIKKKGIYNFEKDKYQYVGIYNPQTKYYTIASGYDLSGYNKLQNLEIILAAVFFGGLIITGLASFFFVQQAFEPLQTLNKQIKRTTVRNLKDRIEVVKNFPEINQIALSYNAMMERLSKAFEFQKSFVQHASHELRTPLAIMLSQTESALNKKLSDNDIKKLLYSLKEDQQGMIELTNSLLLLSQYDQLGYQKEWPKIRIDEVVVEAGSQLMQMFPDAKIHIGFKEIPETDEAYFVTGNESLLKSVFINLFKNAYLYASDKTVAVAMDNSKGKVRVQVENNGTILSDEDSSKVMEPFYRGRNAIDTSTKGFGLGLSIVNRIVLAHHGAVAYESPAANTNRFTVILPQSIK
ncbi:MAG: HAMP domain-containing histidine kinase [Chitinophagaceae bacterium]|nr:HAMP domain-containing histidine kinase [Chitinophagaceae bacterium]